MEAELLLQIAITCVTGTLAIAVVWIVFHLVPGLSGNARAWLWWLVCLKFLFGLLPLPAFFSALPIVAIPALSTASPHIPVVYPNPAVRPPTETLTAQSSAPSDNVDMAGKPFPWTSFLMAFWFVGIGVGIGMQLMALVQLRRLTMGAEQWETAVMAEAAKRAGLHFCPQLLVSPSIIEPLVIAGRRTSILISQDDRNRLSDSELLSVLAHECVHIRRGDLFFALIPWLAQTLFWFLPPVYLAVREFELSREAACDQQTVVALAIAPRAYGELLLKLSSPVSPLPVPASAMALSAGFRNLKRRIQMLETKPARRRFLVALSLLAVSVLLPWQLTLAAPSFPVVDIPNLDFSHRLEHWHKFADGSDTEPHPFYTVGTDEKIIHNGKPVAFVKANANIAQDDEGDGGVLRYDIPAQRFIGKRLRWSGYILGKGLSGSACLIIGAYVENAFLGALSPEVKPDAIGWQRRECVFEIPAHTRFISLALRLSGKGIAYGSGFKLEVVDKKVPLSPVMRGDDESSSQDKQSESDNLAGPVNLDLSDGLSGWSSDDPVGYELGIAKQGGRMGGPAGFIRNRVANPLRIGSFAQIASAHAYLGKRIRLSGYVKSENATRGELTVVLMDNNEQGQHVFISGTNGKLVKGTQDWTLLDLTVDIPTNTATIGLGLMSTGKGTVWTDGFKIEVVDKP